MPLHNWILKTSLTNRLMPMRVMCIPYTYIMCAGAYSTLWQYSNIYVFISSFALSNRTEMATLRDRMWDERRGRPTQNIIPKGTAENVIAENKITHIQYTLHRHKYQDSTQIFRAGRSALLIKMLHKSKAWMRRKCDECFFMLLVVVRIKEKSTNGTRRRTHTNTLRKENNTNM